MAQEFVIRNSFLFTIILLSLACNGTAAGSEPQVEEAKLLIISNFEAYYKNVIASTGGSFSVIIKDESPAEEASAYSDGKTMTVTLSLALLKSPRLSDDGLRFTLCYEMGHLLGGEPRRNVPFDWDGPTAPDGRSLMSSEGQADYYAANTCFGEIVDATDTDVLRARIGLGALNMLQLSKDFDISFDTPSQEVVNETIIDAYPPRQCRLDTAVAGARQGPRPRCWYK